LADAVKRPLDRQPVPSGGAVDRRRDDAALDPARQRAAADVEQLEHLRAAEEARLDHRRASQMAHTHIKAYAATATQAARWRLMACL
jgi:hypothetical protein